MNTGDEDEESSKIAASRAQVPKRLSGTYCLISSFHFLLFYSILALVLFDTFEIFFFFSCAIYLSS